MEASKSLAKPLKAADVMTTSILDAAYGSQTSIRMLGPVIDHGYDNTGARNPLRLIPLATSSALSRCSGDWRTPPEWT